MGLWHKESPEVKAHLVELAAARNNLAFDDTGAPALLILASEKCRQKCAGTSVDTRSNKGLELSLRLMFKVQFAEKHVRSSSEKFISEAFIFIPLPRLQRGRTVFGCFGNPGGLTETRASVPSISMLSCVGKVVHKFIGFWI